ncbi:MAG: DNA/RNA non-specific endonuclease [Lachnospiraceae bacterium]|nr:DNA/RNA non-specific endonuclease [Lachnospiraceae bacterium]
MNRGNLIEHKRKKLRKNQRLRTLRIVLSVIGLALIISGAVALYNYLNGSDAGSYSKVSIPVFSEDEPSLSIVDAAPDNIPEFDSMEIIELNDNIPMFTAYDKEHIIGETYSEKDDLGRCHTAVARLNASMMPKEPRGEIGDIRPSGYRQARYPGLIESDPPFLYNRCHLIAYALTGRNADPLNLITGTRHMNVDLMLKYEMLVINYLEDYNGNVLYRVSPYFRGDELVARGVEIEAYSVEDHGSGVCFHVFIYNIQPGVEIDYETGLNRLIG